MRERNTKHLEKLKERKESNCIYKKYHVHFNASGIYIRVVGATVLFRIFEAIGAAAPTVASLTNASLTTRVVVPENALLMEELKNVQFSVIGGTGTRVKITRKLLFQVPPNYG